MTPPPPAAGRHAFSGAGFVGGIAATGVFSVTIGSAQLVIVRRGAAVVARAMPTGGARALSGWAAAVAAAVIWQFSVPWIAVAAWPASNSEQFNGRVNVDAGSAVAELLLFGCVPNVAIAVGGVLVCAVVLNMAARVAALTARVAPSGGCDLREEVPSLLREVGAVVAVTQRLANCTFASLLVLVLSFVAEGATDDANNLRAAVFLADLALPALCAAVALSGARLSSALQALHLAVLDPRGRGGGGADGSEVAAAARDVGVYLSGLEAKGALSFRVFGIATTWGNMARLTVTVGTAAGYALTLIVRANNAA